jgi:hypothetical protein
LFRFAFVVDGHDERRRACVCDAEEFVGACGESPLLARGFDECKFVRMIRARQLANDAVLEAVLSRVVQKRNRDAVGAPDPIASHYDPPAAPADCSLNSAP